MTLADDASKPLLNTEIPVSRTDSECSISAAGYDGDDGFSLGGGSNQSKLLTNHLLLVVITAILSSFQFGWNVAVLNTPEMVIRACKGSTDSDPASLITTRVSDDSATTAWTSWLGLPRCIPMDQWQWGLAVGIFAVGGFTGSMLSGQLGKRLGRRSSLQYINIIAVLGTLINAFAMDKVMFGIGRVLIGMSCGASTAVVPVYIGEIAPTALRGTLGAAHQLAIVVGILCTQALGIPLSSAAGWRWLIALNAVPSLLQWLLLPLCAESPRFLLTSELKEEASKALRRLRGPHSDVTAEFRSMLAARQQASVGEDGTSSQQSSLSVFGLFTAPRYRKALVIAITAQLAQQWSGINGVIQYSTNIFEAFLGDQASVVTVVVGLVNLLTTITAMLLIERAGRRALLLFSQFGMAILSALIVLSSIYRIDYLTAAAVVAFVAVFAIGLGPIPWLIMPEIFPTLAISSAASVGITINWISTFLVSTFFPVIAERLGDFTFLPFSIISLLLGILMYSLLPETKGRSVEEISALLQ